jgi:hypothetical protein
MKIEVTQDDIDKGHRKMSRSCPVALAVKRAYGAEEVVADNCLISVYDVNCKPIKKFKTSTEVSHFMMDFDDSLPVQPFSFEVPD